MFTIGKMVLSLLLLALIAASQAACVSINKPPDNQHGQVNVGGSHGVTVDH